MKTPKINSQTLMLLVVLAVVGYCALVARDLDSRVRIAIQQKRMPMQTITEEVTRNSNQSVVTLTTTRQEGESAPDFVARHQEAKDAIEAS